MKLTKKASILSASLQRQLNMYALVAGAAGVGAAATLAQPAEAKIVYTRTHQVVEVGYHYDIDLNHDGITDFLLSNQYQCWSCWRRLRFIPANDVGNRVVDSGHFVLPMKKGLRIGSGDNFGRSSLIFSSYFCQIKDGTWYDGKRAYVGLKFKIKGKTHYGWARMTVTGKCWVTATLTGYAYETIPNKAIEAGRTQGPDDVVIRQPDTTTGSLGDLALGRK